MSSDAFPPIPATTADDPAENQSRQAGLWITRCAPADVLALEAAYAAGVAALGRAPTITVRHVVGGYWLKRGGHQSGVTVATLAEACQTLRNLLVAR